MSPRGYRMERRSEAAEATRRRIVGAAIELHARWGSSRTSWDDIASAAGVSRATVYHHFPSLTQLIPACARAAFEAIDPPTAEQAALVFPGLDTPAARLHRLIVETCRCYSAGSEWLRVAWAERDFVAPMGDAVRRVQQGLETLVEAALAGLSTASGPKRLVIAALDFAFWDALVRAGCPPEDAPGEIERIVMPVLAQLKEETQ